MFNRCTDGPSILSRSVFVVVVVMTCYHDRFWVLRRLVDAADVALTLGRPFRITS